MIYIYRSAEDISTQLKTSPSLHSPLLLQFQPDMCAFLLQILLTSCRLGDEEVALLVAGRRPGSEGSACCANPQPGRAGGAPSLSSEFPQSQRQGEARSRSGLPSRGPGAGDTHIHFLHSPAKSCLRELRSGTGRLVSLEMLLL